MNMITVDTYKSVLFSVLRIAFDSNQKGEVFYDSRCIDALMKARIVKRFCV